MSELIKQTLIWKDGGGNPEDALERAVRSLGKSVLLVCDPSIGYLDLNKTFEGLEARGEVRITRFGDFEPNPDYSSVIAGIKAYREAGCDCIIAVGGGSAMDVAKCVKLFALNDPDADHLSQRIVENDIPLMAVPTTAGTGSEATRYAVVYRDGVKQSVTHRSCIPGTVYFDPDVLNTLPAYQKKATMLDALCHGIESMWSVNSTEESMRFSEQSIVLILKHAKAYLAGDHGVNERMFRAAYLAGRAINITQTTAGHAMCYKLTGLYGIAHGHAAALCVDALWPWMLKNPERCIDPRGPARLELAFDKLAGAFLCGREEAPARFDELLKKLSLPGPRLGSENELQTLTGSVNPVRLANHPVGLDPETIKRLYIKILA